MSAAGAHRGRHSDARTRALTAHLPPFTLTLTKVLALLTHVTGLLQGVGGAGGAGGAGGEGGGLGEGAARARAQHELGVLQRLVGASVSALRMPDAAPEANGAEENRPPMMPAQGAQGGGGASSRGRENRFRH